MIKYLLLVQEERNSEIVTTVLRPILEGDLLTDDVVKENLSKLSILKDIGERDVFDQVIRDLQEDDTYRKHME